MTTHVSTIPTNQTQGQSCKTRLRYDLYLHLVQHVVCVCIYTHTYHVWFHTHKNHSIRHKMEKNAYTMLVFVGCVGMLLMISTQGSAEQHVVGGKQGWDESTDFDSWASGQTFKVGDTLGKLPHSVIHGYAIATPPHVTYCALTPMNNHSQNTHMAISNKKSKFENY